jgi:hypothetical protein
VNVKNETYRSKKVIEPFTNFNSAEENEAITGIMDF